MTTKIWWSEVYSNCRYRSLNSQTTTFRRRLQLSDEEKIKVRLHSNGHRLGHLRIEPPYRAAGRGLDFQLEPSVHGVREGCHEMDREVRSRKIEDRRKDRTAGPVARHHGDAATVCP